MLPERIRLLDLTVNGHLSGQRNYPLTKKQLLSETNWLLQLS